jgi:3-methyladenine DNA glycosylase AlkD
MSSDIRRLAAAVRQGLAEREDPERAAGMQAYLKSAMPCRGVRLPVQRRLYRDIFEAHPLDGVEAWREAVLTLWREAAYREERYAAIELTGNRAYRVHQTPAALPLYEELVVTGAWWDLVDPVATSRVDALLRTHPVELGATVRAWARASDLWLRRTAIICQVQAKAETDTALLEAAIAPNLTDRDFFIRKAIGWALRAHAWTDPEWVGDYVARHEAELSPLSRREALKNVSAR